MESSKPIIINREEDFLSFNLSFDSNKYDCYFTNVNQKKIKIRFFSDNYLDKFEKELNLSEFQSINKYFKLFDDLKAVQNDLISLKNSNCIEISDATETKIDISISVLTTTDNIVTITLNKAPIKPIEKIVRENERMRRELIAKNSKIIKLEKEIQELKQKNNNLIKKLKKYQQKENRMFMDSEIFLNQNEKNLVLNQISDEITSINKIFDSKKDGDEPEKLKNAYLNKTNLIFAVKTEKGRRFGGFSSEPFLEDFFAKFDEKSFLFSLDHFKIMKAKKVANYHLWNCENNSIQFGGGSDLRIFHDFSSYKNYTIAGTYYDYGDSEPDVLNGEKYFFVEKLEIYQVFI